LILLFSNAYNFADGMDGLAGGLGIFMAAGLVGLAAAGGYSPASLPVVAAVAAAMIPFLVLNYPPAKVFMGDIGALPIGAIMGWAVFEFLWQPGGFAGTGLIAGIAIWSLVMLVELIPPPLQVLWFKTKGRRLFPFKTPIHHGMQDKGMPEGRVTVTLVAAQALCSILAVAITWAVIS
jgi:phospho-N-acetylmuramoyl-pentapeptide-transferase